MKTVQVCDHGECGGECYQCRLRRVESEMDRLLDAVAEMRHAQKDFFRTRSKTALERSRRAERLVDKIVSDRSLPSLF